MSSLRAPSPKRPSHISAITAEEISRNIFTVLENTLGNLWGLRGTFAVPTNNGLDVTTHFSVPYVRWGMKNPSTLFLRVGDTVSIDVHAAGRIQPGS